MNPLGVYCPAPPDWTVDWERINDGLSWIRGMKDCPQDPVFHAEGDVWIHVHMVCEAMAGMEEWRALAGADRELLFAAALLHDVAKPVCTRMENGRITSRGHSHRGATLTRRLLWEMGAGFELREHICALVRFHQFPFYLIERTDAERSAFLISQSARCDLLAILATADALGRDCNDQQEILLRVQLFQEFCRERGCLSTPYLFPSAFSRFEYFRTPGRDPHFAARDSTKCEVTLMSGLPGAGKDTWISQFASGLPVISLDEIRAEIGARPTGDQGTVVQMGRERAKEFLRSGRGFVWNATNLSRELRGPLIELFTAYQARVRLVYVEAPRERLLAQNRTREAALPDAAMERLLERWDVADRTEATRVEWWENRGSWLQVGTQG